jgi:hypothetical protein
MARPCPFQTSELTSIDERALHGHLWSLYSHALQATMYFNLAAMCVFIAFHIFRFLLVMAEVLVSRSAVGRNGLGLLPMHAVYADLDRGSCKTLRRRFR